MKTLIIIFTISIIILVAVFTILAIMVYNKGWNSDKRSKLATLIKDKSDFLCNIPAGKYYISSATLCYIGNCLKTNADCIANKFSHKYKYDDKYVKNLTYDVIEFAFNNDCLESCGYKNNKWDTNLINAINSDTIGILNYIYLNNPKSEPSADFVTKYVNCTISYLATKYKPYEVLGIICHILLDINGDGIVGDVKNIVNIINNIKTTCNK